MARKLNIPILGLIENMSYACCSHCNEKLELFGPSRAGSVATELNLPLLGSLPWDMALNQAMDQGRIEEYLDPEVEKLAKELLKARS